MASRPIAATDIADFFGPKNNIVAYFGDSITKIATVLNTATLTANSNRAHSVWAHVLSRQRVVTEQSLNFGLNGDTAANMNTTARLAPVLASPAGIVVVEAGTNDLTLDTTANIVANINGICRQITGSGKLCVLIPIPPRQLATGTGLAQLWAVNRKLRQFPSSIRGLYVADSGYFYGDPTSTTGTPRAGYSYDNLHPMARGGYALGKPLAAVFNQIFPDPGFTIDGVSDVWSTTNATGSLLANGMMAGTGGTTGTGLTGSTADSWSTFVSAGGGTITSLTAAASKTTDVYGRTQQQIALGGTFTGGFATVVGMSQTMSNVGVFVQGDAMEASIEYEVDANLSGVSGVSMQMSAPIGGTTYVWEDGYPVVSDAFTAEGHAGVLRIKTDPFGGSLPSVVYIQPRVYLIQGAQTAAGAIRFTGATLRKV